MSAVENLDAPFPQRLSPIKSADVHESDSNVLARRLHGMGSSFFWATQLLSVPQREATYRIYAFCRELEDIADGEAASSVKHSLFAEWRNEIASLYAGEPRHALTRGLSDAVRLYGLRSDDFVAVINGREMDVPSGIRAPTFTQLDLYCERIAAAPARLRDQYQHPEEHRHTIAEVQQWFHENDVAYLSTYPSALIGDRKRDLFAPAADNWRIEGWLAQLGWIRSLGHEGGLFVTIGRREGGVMNANGL